MNTKYLVLPLLILITPSWGEEPTKLAGIYEVEAGFSSERLTKNHPDWSSQYLFGSRKGSDGNIFFGGWRATDRFSAKDQEIHAGTSLAVAPHFRLQLEGGFSEDPMVLPKHYGEVGGQFELGGGWVVDGAWRVTSYEQGDTQVLRLATDYYGRSGYV